MHDIRLIRDDPSGFDRQLARRGVEPVAAGLVATDAQLREVQTEMQAAQARRNEASKLIGKAMAGGNTEEAEGLKAEVAGLKARIPELEERERTLKAELDSVMSALPNLPAADVPDGLTEDDNQFVKDWGEKPSLSFTPKPHDELIDLLGMDMEASAAIAGSRFAVLHQSLAKLHRMLGQFMLDVQSEEHGFRETWVPLLVRDEAMYGTGQLPKFGEDAFHTDDGRWLISTAEVSLTNIARERILDERFLPLTMSALTPCFRSEAGAAGRDTKGLIRQHQFEKVEMVAVTRPEDSDAMHERMLANAEAILQKLDIHYRVMLLSAGDMGAGARKTYDIEVWLPGQDTYREISSVSNCGDYQARRMNARFRPEGAKKPEFVHTLNGSGLAVGRTLVAVLENYQQEDGSVLIPDALKPYARGLEKLTPIQPGDTYPPVPAAGARG
ncbi:serine--tRNA ligase [Pacificimonas flava]|uniref:Serine--tRNA ligase n=2 Tax=Pacificimonas TaxID=1960290 RepID=A0A219B3C0_9SPHN|nr:MULTISPECIES: serine--tRNA ligase [Pacificimonas]MBZ6377515.1 serine--tRNA ligase [Pacificimonas aurantium]OWV32791.1 serine--tRNA ligase [Pacificimonas flava]